MKKIKDFIEHLECPVLDGIIFPDETVQLLDIEADRKFPGYNYTIKTASKTTITDLANKGDLQWGNCGIQVKLIDQTVSLEIIAGEADYGSDGFIAVIDLNSKVLIWLAFFTYSNPFSKLKIIDEDLYATSTIGCIWKFNLKNPVNCIAECP